VCGVEDVGLAHAAHAALVVACSTMQVSLVYIGAKNGRP